MLSIAFLLSFALGASARPLIEIGAADIVPTRDHGWFDIIVDRDRRLHIDDLLGADNDLDFRVATAVNVNLGYTQSALWARFSLHYTEQRRRPLFLVIPKPLLDEVELFAVHADGSVTRSISGDAFPYSAQRHGYRGIAFELEAEPGQRVDYYLHVRSPSSAIGAPLQLMDASAFATLSQTENFLLGGYFGVMVGLAIASILLFLTFRNRIFLYYFLYLCGFTLTLFAVSGYGFKLLWPHATEFQQHIPSTLIVATMIAGVIFVRHFLNLVSRWRNLIYLMTAVCAIGAAAAVLNTMAISQTAMVVVLGCAIALCVIGLVAFARCMLAGERIARYFICGWLACVIGIFAAIADLLGLTPTSMISAYGLYIGSLAEFAALSIALGDRLRALQLEKETEIESANTELATLNQNLESMVRQRTQELEKRNRELSELAIRDSLTGLYNHSTSIELLEQILSQSVRYKFPVTVLMVDIDHFKRINDSYGHQVGDEVLEVISQTLLDSVRDSDVVGRYGGEEFLITMPHADVLAAREFGERLLHETRRIAVPQALGESLSVSIGIAVSTPLGLRVSAAQLIQSADQALYRSKRDGRDCLTVDSLSVVQTSRGAPFGGPLEPAR